MNEVQIKKNEAQINTNQLGIKQFTPAIIHNQEITHLIGGTTSLGTHGQCHLGHTTRNTLKIHPKIPA
jgi:hypothetical protein